ncbi:hypothetical protein [Phenylobacterium sp.]|uniref:hypothetical protein n=1 Tax=Phenylobacterium sp. TaxID=1871053 RepID=UPI0035B33408
MLASVLALSSLGISSCSEKPAAPEAPPAFGLSTAEHSNGVLDSRTVKVTSKDGYAADVTLTPSWRVSGRKLDINWYAGLSQTKRFFQIANESGDAAKKPNWLVNPDQGVRGVRVAFDGGELQANKPTTTRSVFDVPEGAKTVTEVQFDFGDPDAPVTATWK